MAGQLVYFSSKIQDLEDRLSSRGPTPSAPERVIPALEPTWPPHYAGSGPRLAPPERYSGEPGQCKSFITDCSMHFKYSPWDFPSDRAKVAFMISHLTGKARSWATAEWSRDSPLCNSVSEFQAALQKVFEPLCSDREKARELSWIRQGREAVSDYAVRFRTLASESGWNSTALYDVFLKGLAAPIREQLVPLDLPQDLDSLIALAIARRLSSPLPIGRARAAHSHRDFGRTYAARQSKAHVGGAAASTSGGSMLLLRRTGSSSRWVFQEVFRGKSSPLHGSTGSLPHTS